MKSRLLSLLILVRILSACSNSTEPNPDRFFDLYTWQFGSTSVLVGEGAITNGNYLKINSASVTLHANGSVDESINYVYAVPSTGTQISAAESFHGRYLVNANGLTEIHLPLATDPDATVGFLQPDQSLPLFRAWDKAGVNFGGNFLYLKR